MPRLGVLQSNVNNIVCFFPAFAVRYITKRYIGDYDRDKGELSLYIPNKKETHHIELLKYQEEHM